MFSQKIYHFAEDVLCKEVATGVKSTDSLQFKLSAQPFTERPDHRVLLHHTQFREDGDADNFGSETVGDAAIRAGDIAGVGKTFLLVHRDRIVDFAADSRRSEVLFEGITLALPDDTQGVLVPDVLVVGIGNRKNDFSPGGRENFILGFGAFAMGWIGKDDSRKGSELFRVTRGIGLTLLGVAVVVAEFDAEQSGLQGVEPEIAPDHFVVVFGLAAVGAQEAGPFGQRIIVGNQKTAVAEASEILGREEAVSAEVPDGADWFAFVFAHL